MGLPSAGGALEASPGDPNLTADHTSSSFLLNRRHLTPAHLSGWSGARPGEFRSSPEPR